MSMWRYRLAVAITAVVLALTAPSVQGEAECCSTCIGKTASGVYDYDPVVYEQCRLKPNGVARICCFECGSLGEPQYSDTVSYGSDGTTPTITAGKWVSFQWPSVTKVTYTALKENQKKTVTPTLTDTAATITSGYFMICAKAQGSIIMRGWGDDTCRQASTEKNITVLEGDAGGTCEASAPTAPTTSTTSSSSGSSSDDANVQGCNLNRASIKKVDGKNTCVCVDDWSGAPACDQMPAWKWIITIGGGIAALLSIVISVRAFMNSRKKKQVEDDEDERRTTPAPVKDDVEILQIGADQHQNTPTQTAYKRGYDDKHGVYKMNDREFSL